MSRTISVVLAVVIAILLPPLTGFAAPAHPKRHIYHWHGYGFLPGYHQPPDNSVPPYAEKHPARAAEWPPRNEGNAPAFFNPYTGGWYYYGNPGFYRGRFNGGSFGPCWTQTPIGPIWNCG